MIGLCLHQSVFAKKKKEEQKILLALALIQSNISAIEQKSEYGQLSTAEQNSLDSLIKKQWQCNLHIESMWRQKSRQI